MNLFVILSIFLLMGVTAQDKDNFESDNHLEMRTRIFWPQIHTTGNCIRKCPSLLEKLFFYAKLPHDDCNLYCLCLLGYQMVKQCPDNKHYSESLNQCVEPKEAQCANKFDGCLGNCTLSHDGLSDGRLIAHQSCSKFCKCKPNGRLELQECAPNLHFSVENQSCINPEDAKCKVEINGSTDDENQSKSGNKSNMKGCSEKCPETNSPNYTVIIPHNNCNYFCKCNWGKPVVIKCPDSLHFNNQIKTCDTVINARCTDSDNVNFNQENNKSNYSLEENFGSIEPTFNEEIDNINNEKSNIEESNNVNSESNFETKEPNSNDEAHNNESIKSNSSESDTDFTESILNKNTNIVNNKLNSKDENNNKNESNSTEEPKEAAEINYSNENNKSEIIEEKNNLNIESANNDNNNENSTEKTRNENDKDTSSSTDNQNNIDDGCIGSCPLSSDSNKVFALEHIDCKKYCICVNGFPVAKNCSSGLYFDEIIRQCVISKFSRCGNNNQKEHSAHQSTTHQNKSLSENQDVIFQSNVTEVNNSSQDFSSSNENWSEDEKDKKKIN